MRHRPHTHGSSVSKSPTGRRARSKPSRMGTSSGSSSLRPLSTSPTCWFSTNLSPGSTPPVSMPSGTCWSTRHGPGCCVLFSSHQLDLVEDLCEQVTIIDHGRLVVSGTVDDLASSGARRLVVRVEGERKAIGPAPSKASRYRKSPPARSGSSLTTTSTATSCCGPRWLQDTSPNSPSSVAGSPRCSGRP